ncbi:glycosyltransferase [Paenibacillus sp. PK3_47]|uniref:glycosyltransferase n=1 Tax=Paenibacillus sp. PK3_47 TaxID=2072642 RepID=UPI00201D6884|nr:glycosyltransferase [Paenibacillus sp. PK3_47]
MRERMLFLYARNRPPEDLEETARTRSLLDILLEKFDIDLLEYCQDSQGDYSRIGSELKVHTINRTTGPERSLLNPLHKLHSRAGLTRTDKNLRSEIAEMCKLNAYSHVFISRGLLGKCIDIVSSLLPDAKIIADAFRMESRHLEAGAVGKRGLSRRYYELNAALTRREERKLLTKSSLLLTASGWDALSFKALSFADAGKVHVVPQSVHLRDYSYHEPVSKENGVVLHWYMHTSQGKNAALIFHRKIYPLIKAKVPDCRCFIAGGDGEIHPEVLALSKEDPSVVIVQEGEDVNVYIRKARAVVGLLREGCGGQLKILEAWALRTPVVTSLKGSEELNCQPGRNILLASTMGEMAEQVAGLLQTPEHGSIIADAAYRTLLADYEADIVKAKVLKLV